MNARLRRMLALPWVLLLLGGCALTSRGKAIESRYFSADFTPATAPQDSGKTSSAQGDEGMVLRLGRIRAGSDLKEEIVYRTSSHELGFYEEYRWAERPETYLRRGLVQVLFTERGLRQSVAGLAPTLDVEMLAFEEVRGDRPAARVALMVALHDEKVVRYSRTIEVSRPLVVERGTVDPTALAAALTLALHEAVKMVADDVVREMNAGYTRAAKVSP